MGVLTLRRAVREVRDDLWTPWLYVPAYAPRRASSGLGLRLGRRMLARHSAPLPGVEVERRTLANSAGRIAAYTYEPGHRSRPSGALVWVHGGGLVAGAPGQDHDLCSLLAAEAGLLVVSVDYRLAPEHPFPAALDDCEAALRWVHQEAATLGVDVEAIAVGGSSAGGGLAAALAQRAHDDGHVHVAFQLLVYPMLDDRTTLRRDHQGRGRLVWTPATNRFGWACYLGHEPGPEPPPYAAAARRTDLAGLPPAWIGVGDLDLLHDEAVDYAQRLRAAGIRCELHVEPGMYHAADAGSQAPSMQQFRARMAAALAERLRG